MMKLAIVLVALALGCGGKKNNPSTPTNDPPTEGVECAKEIALVCPDGQIDGCLKTPQEGTTHACVAN